MSQVDSGTSLISLLWGQSFLAMPVWLVWQCLCSPILSRTFENAVLDLCLMSILWALESLPKGNGRNVHISLVNATRYFLSVHLCVDAGWLYSTVRAGFCITVLGNCISSYVLQNPHKIGNLAFVKKSVSFKMKLKIT